MKLLKRGVWMAGIGIGSVGLLLAADQPNVDDLTRELKGEKPAAVRTPAQLDAAYVQVVAAILPDLGSDDLGRRGGAQGTLETLAFRASRPGAEAERAACSQAIASTLGSGTNAAARVWLLRQLERMGRAEAVPAETKLLADPDALIRESARRALQKNPSREANAALQQAIGAADAPAWRAALVNALAARREASNLKLLLKEAKADNDDVRGAALIGLSRLGDKSAAKVIAASLDKGTPAARMIAADAYLRLAAALCDAGDKSSALRIYKQFLADPGFRKCAAIVGIGRAGSPSDLRMVFECMADPDVKVRGACVEALCLMEGPKVTPAIAEQVATAKPEAEIGFLQALARRGDKAAVPALVSAAANTNEDVRTAAFAGLGALGGPAAVPLLLKAAATGGKPQTAARQSLQCLPGADTDQALVAAIGTGEPPMRIEVVHALAARHVLAATPALLKAAEDADGGVRAEALRALGVVASASALPDIAAVLAKTGDDGTRNEAAGALVKIATRESDLEARSAPVLKALASAGGPARLALLGALGRMGGQQSLAAVRAAVQDGDEKVRDAAIRALADWPDATAADDLLGVAKGSANETQQVLALRGYIRVCRIRTGRPDAETAKLLAAGLAAAKRPDEKREAIGGLAEVRDLLALQSVVPCMGDEPLREEAASAAVRIGRDIWNQQPEAVKAAMQKVLEVTRDDNRKKEAREALDHAEQKLKESAPKP